MVIPIFVLMQDARFLVSECLHFIATQVSYYIYIIVPTIDKWGGLAQWLASRTTDQGVPGSRPGRAQFVVALSKSHLPTA